MKYKILFIDINDECIVNIPEGYIPLNTYSNRKDAKIICLKKLSD